ncbi:hypothetical protein FS749_000804 [Ceratobasidium sp. UAMH 11750]|nr:hypothetical protein FS749_000804 [Ceratobasidium sp. UAMH 11750]
MSVDPKTGELITRAENFRLNPENVFCEISVKARGRQYVGRTITCFRLMRGEQQVSPSSDDGTPEFWKGVHLEGYVASLGGESRHHVMAGWWNLTGFGDLHHEHMKIEGIVRLAAGTDKNWRGSEAIMWFYTSMGYAYACQHPDPRFKSDWVSFVKNRASSNGNASALFRSFAAPWNKPSWWWTKRDWNFFMKNVVSAPPADNGAVEVSGLAEVGGGDKVAAEDDGEADGEGELDEGGYASILGSEVNMEIDQEGDSGDGEVARSDDKGWSNVQSRVNTRAQAQSQEGTNAQAKRTAATKANAKVAVKNKGRGKQPGATQGVAPKDRGQKRKADAIDELSNRTLDPDAMQVDEAPAHAPSPVICDAPSRSLQMPQHLRPDDWTSRRASAAERDDTAAAAGLHPSSANSAPGGGPAPGDINRGPPGDTLHLSSRFSTPMSSEQISYPLTQRPPATPSQSDTTTEKASSRGEGYDADHDGSLNSHDSAGGNTPMAVLPSLPASDHTSMSVDGRSDVAAKARACLNRFTQYCASSEAAREAELIADISAVNSTPSVKFRTPAQPFASVVPAEPARTSPASVAVPVALATAALASASALAPASATPATVTAGPVAAPAPTTAGPVASAPAPTTAGPVASAPAPTTAGPVAPAPAAGISENYQQTNLDDKRRLPVKPRAVFQR